MPRSCSRLQGRQKDFTGLDLEYEIELRKKLGIPFPPSPVFVHSDQEVKPLEMPKGLKIFEMDSTKELQKILDEMKKK